MREFLDDVAHCNILHIDMDAFFASVEVRDNPELQGKPVIIGHEGGRGVVTSATYEARQFGVRSAMPVSQALRLAPNAIVIQPHMDKYAAVSHQVMNIFESFTPMVQPISIDEAFLDVSGAIKLLGSPLDIARGIREKVWQEERITCSVGIAPSMFIAKLATNQAKPDGIYVVAQNRVLDFLHPLPLSAMWGIGSKTEEQLNRLGLVTVGDLAKISVQSLAKVIGTAHATHLSELAWGRDVRIVETESKEKSISNERTFGVDIEDLDELTNQLMFLCDMVARRLRESNVATRTVALKIRFADFKTISRSRTLPVPTDTAQDMFAAARPLLETVFQDTMRVRLLGVRAEQLVAKQDIPSQLNFTDRETGWREVEQVLDQVGEKFGKNYLRHARLVRRQDSQDFDNGQE